MFADYIDTITAQNSSLQKQWLIELLISASNEEGSTSTRLHKIKDHLLAEEEEEGAASPYTLAANNLQKDDEQTILAAILSKYPEYRQLPQSTNSSSLTPTAEALESEEATKSPNSRPSSPEDAEGNSQAGSATVLSHLAFNAACSAAAFDFRTLYDPLAMLQDEETYTRLYLLGTCHLVYFGYASHQIVVASEETARQQLKISFLQRKRSIADKEEEIATAAKQAQKDNDLDFLDETESPKKEARSSADPSVEELNLEALGRVEQWELECREETLSDFDEFTKAVTSLEQQWRNLELKRETEKSSGKGLDLLDLKEQFLRLFVESYEVVRRSQIKSETFSEARKGANNKNLDAVSDPRKLQPRPPATTSSQKSLPSRLSATTLSTSDQNKTKLLRPSPPAAGKSKSAAVSTTSTPMPSPRQGSTAAGRSGSEAAPSTTTQIVNAPLCAEVSDDKRYLEGREVALTRRTKLTEASRWKDIEAQLRAVDAQFDLKKVYTKRGDVRPPITAVRTPRPVFNVSVMLDRKADGSMSETILRNGHYATAVKAREEAKKAKKDLKQSQKKETTTEVTPKKKDKKSTKQTRDTKTATSSSSTVPTLPPINTNKVGAPTQAEAEDPTVNDVSTNGYETVSEPSPTKNDYSDDGGYSSFNSPSVSRGRDDTEASESPRQSTFRSRSSSSSSVSLSSSDTSKGSAHTHSGAPV